MKPQVRKGPIEDKALEQFTADHMTLSTTTMGQKDGPIVVWGHGWGQSHQAFVPLATSLEKMGQHVLVDFPGFGDSPAPENIVGTEDYADLIASWAKDQGINKLIWIGHSFGCRVGIQLAARYPDLVQSMILIAAAGLPRKKSLYKTFRILTYKALKALGVNKDWLAAKFGSTDFKNAGPMRAIFVKVVNENLTDQANQVQCPVQLIYGDQDTETPPDIGQRLEKLITNAKMVSLAGQDHYSVLGQGRHQVASLIRNFIKENT